MSEHQSFTRRPRTPEEFIKEADIPISATSVEGGPPPWESARADVTKPYQLRLPEKHYLMLKYIADKTPYSMHSFCMEALLKAIENKALDISESNQ